MNANVLTGVTSRKSAIGSSCTVGSNIVATSAGRAEKAACSVEKFSNYHSIIGSRRCELTSQCFKDTAASFVIGGAGEGEGCIKVRRAGRIRVRSRCWAIRRVNSSVLGLQTVVVVAGCDRFTISRDGDHAELSLNAFGREVGKSDTTGPMVRHRVTEERCDLGPETGRRSDAAEFTEVGNDIVVRIIRIDSGIRFLIRRISTPSAKKGKQLALAR